MCGRYYLGDFTEEEVKEYLTILQEIDRRARTAENNAKIKTKDEIFPSDIVPVIANNKDMCSTSGYNIFYILFPLLCYK